MIRQTLTLVLACTLLLNAGAPLASAQTGKEDAKRAARAKSVVDSLGTGKDARVVVRLRDKSELRGYVSEKDDEGFVVADEATGAGVRVAYAQVERVLTPLDVARGMIHDNTHVGRDFVRGAAVVGGLMVFLIVIAAAVSN